MPDFSAKPSVTLICGKGGSGKTSLAYHYLLNSVDQCAAVFIYDANGQSAHRLRLPIIGTAREWALAHPEKWHCFNPHRMWTPEKLPDAFEWFMRETMKAARSGPGRKIVFVDELWNECSPHNIPPGLLSVIKTGRFEGVEFVGVTQRPREFPIALRSQVTEWICFHTAEAVELDAVRDYFPTCDAVASLPTVGRFIAYNRDSGGTLCGGFADTPGGWGEFPLPE